MGPSSSNVIKVTVRDNRGPEEDEKAVLAILANFQLCREAFKNAPQDKQTIIVQKLNALVPDVDDEVGLGDFYMQDEVDQE